MRCFSISILLPLLPMVRATAGPPSNWQQRNYDTVKAIYNLTIYPHNLAFLRDGEKAIPEGLFNANVKGRVTPVGDFSGAADSIEYFFGLTPPAQAPFYGTWTQADLVSFTSGCPEVASSVVYGTTTGVNSSMAGTYGKNFASIKQVRGPACPRRAAEGSPADPRQVAFWRFDDKGAVVAYDAWLPTLKQYTDRLYGRPETLNASLQAGVIQRLCTEAQGACRGPNQVYASPEDCQAQLAAKPFGTWDNVWSDTVTCRSLHVLLAKIRPDVSLSRSLIPDFGWNRQADRDLGPLLPCRTHWRRQVRKR